MIDWEEKKFLIREFVNLPSNFDGSKTGPIRPEIAETSIDFINKFNHLFKDAINLHIYPTAIEGIVFRFEVADPLPSEAEVQVVEIKNKTSSNAKLPATPIVNKQDNILHDIEIVGEGVAIHSKVVKNKKMTIGMINWGEKDK